MTPAELKLEPSIRPHRHEVRKRLSAPFDPVRSMLQGRSGISQEEQVSTLKEARRQTKEAAGTFETALAEALEILDDAIEKAESRDFQKHQTEKAEGLVKPGTSLPSAEGETDEGEAESDAVSEDDES